MRALVLERKRELALREIALPTVIGPDDVRIRMHTVGICGSDVHYYLHGGAGPCVVRAPMVLGHEASGVVAEVGRDVRQLRPGDRVCMEPGIPNPRSRASKLGRYNVDPEVVFWATPPVHGCLAPFVVHPAAFTFRIPDEVSFGEAAMVEPFAVGMQAAVRARLVPGDTAVVLGAGTIGIMIALAALAGGCSRVLISDVHQPKLDVAGRYDGVVPVNIGTQDLREQVLSHTDGWGADVVFEASGAVDAIAGIVPICAPGGRVVIVGVPVHGAPLDIAAAINKELEISTVFRYANVFDRALKLIASGKVDLRPLISGTFPFDRAVEAFERAASARPGDIKLQIRIDEAA